MKRSTWMSSVVTAAIVLLGFASPTAATPIIYQITGIASGTIGGLPFTNVLVTETLTGDTSTVVAAAACPTCLVNFGTTTVNIPGIGTATVTDPDGIFASVMPITLPLPGFPTVPYVLLATLDHPPATDKITGFGLIGSNDLLGYDLRTSIGPTTGPAGVGRDPVEFVNTDLGKLVFASEFLATGQGTFTATVPEPATLALLGIGLGGLSFSRRRKLS
jgi:hypothetical protein